VSRGIKKLKSGEIVPIYIFYLDKHGGLFNCNTVKVSDDIKDIYLSYWLFYGNKKGKYEKN